MTYRFLNDIVKPWDELNALLAKRLVFQPDLSDVTRMASALAVSIKHQADLRGVPRSVVDGASRANRIMSDVADAAKHGRLRDPSRNNTLQVASLFEYHSAQGFRFVRNVVSVSHESFGELDFMSAALVATKYWMDVVGFRLDRDLAIAEAPNQFFATAFLCFVPKYAVNVSQTVLQFCERRADGTLAPVDPAEVKFEVREVPDGNDAV